MPLSVARRRERSQWLPARHSRRFGEKESHFIPVWNGLLEHREKVGTAIWEFFWLLDKITREVYDPSGSGRKIGHVLGLKPVRADEIARDQKVDERSVRRALDRLEAGGYIRRVRTPHGFRIEVLNSHKFGLARSDKNVRSLASDDRTDLPSDRTKAPERSDKSVRCRSDSAVDSTKDATGVPSSNSSVNVKRGVDDLPQSLYQGFQKQLHGLSRSRFDWAVAQIKSRLEVHVANPRPYWQKALSVFFKNFDEELKWFVLDRFEETIRSESDYPSAVEKLKCELARHDLPYSGPVFSSALEEAIRKTQPSRAIECELRIGRGPEVAAD